jgi:hypothetical protein
MLRDEEIRVDVGRIDGGSFVRVTHVPTGKVRRGGPLHGESPDAAAKRLRSELEDELRTLGLTEYVVGE